jgi:flagellar basal-body rod protein FlgC
MSLFSVFDISGSALKAQTVRLNTTASNMANAETVSSSDATTYRAKQPVFKTLLQEEGIDGAVGAGVQVEKIVESQAPLRTEYNPNHPMANNDGYIFKPNVNVVEEMANMTSASRSYEMNVEVMNTSKQLLLRTILMGQ